MILKRPSPPKKNTQKNKNRGNSENMRIFLKTILISIPRENQEHIEHTHIDSYTGCYGKDQSKSRKNDLGN